MVYQLKTQKYFGDFVSYTGQIRKTYGGLIKKRASSSKTPQNSQAIYPQGYIACLKASIKYPYLICKFMPLLNQELEDLMKRTRLPLVIKPKIFINVPNHFFKRKIGSFSAAWYDNVYNLIVINLDYLTFRNQLLNHEFKHFLDSRPLAKP